MHINYLNQLSRYVTNTSVIKQILSCSTKDVLTHKHLSSAIKHACMNKLSYVKKIFGVFITISHNYNFDFQISKLTYNAHHTHLMYAINTKKIGSCRCKNYILLYLENVTNAPVIYEEVMFCCAIF